MITKNDYSVIIPTYKRSNRVITYNKLREQGYKGKIYLLIGDDDPQIEQYKQKYPNEIVMFSKDDYIDKVDMMDNFKGKNCVVYARNAMWDIAKKLGLKYFCVLDDDYSNFAYRRVFGEQLRGFKVNSLDDIIYCCFDYLDKTKNLDCFAWSQTGDFIGGAGGYSAIGRKRKIMNGFFFKTDTPISFMGRINEDLSASVYHGQRGKMFWTINDITIQQLATQSNEGGLTDLYLDMGTYIKSFYSVIVAPNCVKISTTGNNDMRIHHKVKWNKTSPKLIREIHKKRG